MKRTTLGVLLLATACGSTEFSVDARLANADGEPTAIGNLEIQLLPYDRDAIFAEFEAMASAPEPAVPDSVLRLQQAMASAQDEWQQAESRWNIVRDSLKTLSERLANMNRTSGEYRVAFNAFGDLEGQEQRLDRQSKQAFDRFSDLQTQVTAATDEIRVRRAQWADEAFVGVDSAIGVALEQAGREEMYDTTTATGAVMFVPAAGSWWVHARHELPFEELYWNVPAEVAGGDSSGVVLNRDNAQVRPKL
ncbi:MAG: hypothetical protein ABFS34_07520 [Gemmatimonadota bacterium]